ncbi:MAG: S4 domain-containing protein [Novosphingobium sp.]
MRIDKLLWFLRLTKSRGAAQALVGACQIRLNGKRVERAAQAAETGDVLVLPLPHGALVIELIAVPVRRGPPAEAQSCYRVLDGVRENPIAARENNAPEGTLPP